MSYTEILILSSKYLEKEFYEKIIRDKNFRILRGYSDGLI